MIRSQINQVRKKWLYESPKLCHVETGREVNQTKIGCPLHNWTLLVPRTQGPVRLHWLPSSTIYFIVTPELKEIGLRFQYYLVIRLQTIQCIESYIETPDVSDNYPIPVSPIAIFTAFGKKEEVYLQHFILFIRDHKVNDQLFLHITIFKTIC